MQISRLFGITYRLLHRGNISARELAEEFEVSVRTIYRDIDTLSSVGVPVYAAKGRGGGIRLLPDFVMEKSFFTEGEQSSLLAAVQALGAAKLPDSGATLTKLSGLFQAESRPWVAVDMADWGTENQEKFETLRRAILSRRVVLFTYYGTNGSASRRRVEPVQLWFKSRSWYLRAFCLDRQGARLFKLNRIHELEETEEPCTHACQETEAESVGLDSGPATAVELRLTPAATYRVYDEFEPHSIQTLPDGSFSIHTWFTVDNWVMGYLLSFGDTIEVIAPTWLRQQIYEQMKKMVEIYEKKF